MTNQSPKPLTLIRPAPRQPLNLSITDITETRQTGGHMRWPSDPETTRSLILLTHERVPLRRRLLRWWGRYLIRIRGT